MKETREKPIPRSRRRILYVSDPSSIAMHFLPDPVWPEDLRRWVDMLADNGVDVFVQEVYSQCWSEYWRSERIQYDQRPQHNRFIPMLEEHVQPIDVLIDQSHRRGMTFLAGFRVNDAHGYKSTAGGKFPWMGSGIAELIRRHPDWELTDLPSSAQKANAYFLDFSSSGVREFTLGVMEEVIDRFDVDGIELCYRDDAYFPLGTGRQRASLMTDLIRRARDMLNKKAAQCGKKLQLGARVVSTLKENLDLGLDVQTWVAEGLVDYLSPQDRMFADFNLPLDEFAGLTNSSDCRLYPGLLPWTSQRARVRMKASPLSPATCRAYAHTCYQNGADGISIYNHCTVTRVYPYYPQLLHVLSELRDSEKVASVSRHYIFDPTWTDLPGAECDHSCEIADDRICLKRSTPGAKGQVRLNLFENIDQIGAAQFLFRGFGLSENDELQVRFNGHLIDDRDIGRNKRSDAPLDQWGDPRQSMGRKWACIPEQRIDFAPEPRPAFSSRWFALKPSILCRGKNTLEIELKTSEPAASGSIVIDEFELWIQPWNPVDCADNPAEKTSSSQ